MTLLNKIKLLSFKSDIILCYIPWIKLLINAKQVQKHIVNQTLICIIIRFCYV